MKLQQLLFAVFFTILPLSLIFGQDKTTNYDFFAKKQNSYTLQQTGYYGRMTTFDNGQKLGHSNSTWADVDWNYWVGGGVGLGLKASASWSGTHFTNDQLNRAWSISPQLSYGKTLTDKIGVYGRANVTFGLDKDIFKTPTTTTTDKANLFGYGAEIGLPYRFSKYTSLTASVDYQHLNSKFDDGKQSDNNFGFGLRMEDYLGCSGMRCDPSTGFSLSRNMYQPGTGFIGYDTRGDVHFGKSTLTYNGLPGQSFTSDHNDIDLDLNGAIYVIKYIGIGANVEFGHFVSKSNNGNNKNTSSYLNFDPELFLHVPVNSGLKNLFFKGGGYFGSEKFETKSGTLTFTDKQSVTGFNVGIGYNAFFSEQTALRTCVYYRSVTNKDKDTDDKTQQKGIGASVGFVHSFRF